jgi:hypothetical protein
MDTIKLKEPNEMPFAGRSFDEVLVYGSKEELQILKSWLFDENIRIEAARDSLHQTEQKFIAERKQFQEEMKDLNHRIVQEKKRLKEDTVFFEKKMEILKSGFSQLDMDKRKLEKDRQQFLLQKEAGLLEANHSRYDTVEFLFCGATSLLALKKRYKDLLKMFHPDNIAGDHDMVVAITKYYEKKRREFDFEKQA